MKKTLIVFFILVLINILAFPTLNNINHNTKQIDELINTIDDQTMYLNISDTYYKANDEKMFLNKLSNLDIVKEVDAHALHQPAALTYTGSSYINENNKLAGTIDVPTIYLESADDQKFPIISGHNLTGDDQIVVSSSFANEITNNKPEQLLNTYINNLEIVGIYDDPNQVDIYDIYYMPFSRTTSDYVYYTTSNVAYTIDSKVGEDTVTDWYMSDGSLEYTVTNKIIKVTFNNNDLDSNIEQVISLAGENAYVVSNRGISGYSPQQDYYQWAKQYKHSLLNGLIFLDVISVVTLIALNRKEKNA